MAVFANIRNYGNKKLRATTIMKAFQKVGFSMADLSNELSLNGFSV